MPETMRTSLMTRWLTTLLLGLLTVAFWVLPTTGAEAHRDGCHRWHSCPSDTGSYVCGDLGYYSECPGGKPSDDSSNSDSEPEPPTDYDPPKAPRLSRSQAGAGGRVRMVVRAEKHSTVRVETESGKRVAKATGTGKDQTITFKAKTGRHTYAVTATDKASNESLEATTTVNVDATPPKLSDFVATPGTNVTGASSISFVSEPGATWVLTGAGRRPLRGKVGDSSTTLAVWLPNGTYRTALVLRDKAGNTRRGSRNFTVRVPRPLLTTARTSASNEPRLVYALTGTPRSTGKLVLAHHDDLPFALDNQGSASIALDVADGTYGPGRAMLTDFAGRTTSQPLDEVVVDTTAPELELAADPTQAAAGTLALSVEAEPGSTVHVSGPMKARDLNDAPLDETVTATSTPTLITRQLATGTYTVTATATDAVGNTTTRQIDVKVTVPATPLELALGIVMLVLLCALPVGAAVVGWHYRQRIAAWRAQRRVAAAQRVADRAARAAEAAYQGQLTAYRQDLAVHQTALVAWNRRRAHLENQLAAARTFEPTHDSAGLVQLKRDETSYGTFTTVMVEQRTRRGVTTLDDVAAGQVIITSHRVVFVADRNREWSFAKLAGVVENGDLTLLPVSNRKHDSGLRISAAQLDKFRLRLELALADRRGGRDTVIARHLAALDLHHRQQPAPPAPPAPPQRLAPQPAATVGTPPRTR